MRKHFLYFLIFTIIPLAIKAQIQPKSNELKIDILDIIAVKTLDVAFERNISDESAIGIALLLNFEDEDKTFRYNETYMITPYYRQYLFHNGPIDYYGELFGALNHGERNRNGESIDYTDFALGLSFGGKYTSPKGFIFDFHVGIGRNLFNSDVSEEVVPRLGISLGKRL